VIAPAGSARTGSLGAAKGSVAVGPINTPSPSVGEIVPSPGITGASAVTLVPGELSLAPSAEAPVVLSLLVPPEASDFPVAGGKPEVISEGTADVRSGPVEAESPDAVSGGFVSAEGVAGVVPAPPDGGCRSEVVGADEPVDGVSGAEGAVTLELGVAVESVAPCAPVLVESTGPAVGGGSVGGGSVAVPVAVVVSGVETTDPRSARAVAARNAATSIQQATVAPTVSRKHGPAELQPCN
jgi:hypothetical protein